MLISSMLNVQPPKSTERFKPYSTLNARDRRLEKLLYNTNKTPSISQKLDSLLRPKLYNQFMTMGDKLAKLERLISEFPDQVYSWIIETKQKNAICSHIQQIRHVPAQVRPHWLSPPTVAACPVQSHSLNRAAAHPRASRNQWDIKAEFCNKFTL